MICPKCKTSNPAGSHFCNHCGAKLEPELVFRPGIAPAWVEPKRDGDLLDVLRQDTPEKRAKAAAMVDKLVSNRQTITKTRPPPAPITPARSQPTLQHRHLPRWWIVASIVVLVTTIVIAWLVTSRPQLAPPTTAILPTVPRMAFNAKLVSWITVEELPVTPPIKGRHAIVTLEIENLRDHAIDINCRLSGAGLVVMADSRYGEKGPIQPGITKRAWAFPTPSDRGMEVIVMGDGTALRITQP